MRLIIFLIFFTFLKINFSSAEIIRINCTVKFPEINDKVTNYFELNTVTQNYYNKVIGQKLEWVTVGERSNGNWGTIYHKVDRYTGKYIAEIAKEYSSMAKEKDLKREISDTLFGECVKAEGKKKKF